MLACPINMKFFSQDKHDQTKTTRQRPAGGFHQTKTNGHIPTDIYQQTDDHQTTQCQGVDVQHDC